MTRRGAAVAEPKVAPLFELEDHIFYLFTRVLGRRNRDLEAGLRPLGVTVAQWRVLAVLDHRDGCTMSELAELTAVDRTTLTRTVDRMAAEGRVARRTDPRDRRSVRLHLTAAGRRAFERVLPLVVEQNERALDGLDERDLATLRGALRRMIGNLDHRPTDA